MEASPREKLVLVVDDDVDNREILQMTLEAEGYSVAAAENGLAALEVLRGGARPCLILLDLMMPVMSGWQFCEERDKDKSLSTIPVIVISAVQQREPLPYASVVGYITKPIDLNHLLSSVAKHCDK